MPSSDSSSAWDDLSRDDFPSSPASKAYPVFPTSPSSASRPRQHKDNNNTFTSGFARIFLNHVETPGQQTRQVSGGSVDSGGSSAWGTVASKSILSQVPSSADKRPRGGKKNREVEKLDRVEEWERVKKEEAKEISSSKGKRRETRVSPDSRTIVPSETKIKDKNQSLPQVAEARRTFSPNKSVLVEAVLSAPASQATSAVGEQSQKAKFKRTRKNLNKPNVQTSPPPRTSYEGGSSVSSSTQATFSDYSMIDRDVPSINFDTATDFSIAEMTKRNRANKNGKTPAKREPNVDHPLMAVQDEVNPGELTVTEMTARSKTARNLKRAEQRSRQRARQKAEKGQAGAEESTINPDKAKPPRKSTESIAPSTQTDDTFRSQTSTFDENTNGSGFRMDRGTPYTTRGTPGTAENSRMVVPRKSMIRGDKQNSWTRASEADQATGSGSGLAGPVPSTALHTKTSDANTSYGRLSTAKSTATESVAPHHSISRRGSMHAHNSATPDSSASAIIIGLEGLAVGNVPARETERIQPVLKRDAIPSQSSLRVPVSSHSGRTKQGSGGPSRSAIYDDHMDARSITSYEEAHSSVRAFLVQDQTFLGDERNRLAFWQGLCIEFGLAVSPSHIEATLMRDSFADPYAYVPSPPLSPHLSSLDTPTRYMLDLSPVPSDDSASDSEDILRSRTLPNRRGRARSRSIGSDNTALQGDESRSSTPRAFLPVVPSTSRGCFQLLKTHAHVNLYDWWIVRGEVDDKEQEMKRLGKAIGPEEEEEVYAPLRALVFPSASQMIRYTHKTKKFMNKIVLKQAWLQPLMRDMHFGPTRTREEHSEYLDRSDQSDSTATSVY